MIMITIYIVKINHEFLNSYPETFCSRGIVVRFWLRQHAPAGGHPREHVVVDVAVQQPVAGRAWDHVDRGHAGGQHLNHVGAATVGQHCLSMPVHGVVVLFVTQRGDMPADALAQVGFIALEVAENAAVDGVL